MANITLTTSIVTSQAMELANSKGLTQDRLKFDLLGLDATTLIAIERLSETDAQKPASEVKLGFLKSILWIPVRITGKDGKEETVLVNRSSALKRLERLGFNKKEIQIALEQGSLESLILSHKASQLHKELQGTFDLSQCRELLLRINKWRQSLQKNGEVQVEEFNFCKKEIKVIFYGDYVEFTVSSKVSKLEHRINLDFPEYASQMDLLVDKDGFKMLMQACQLGKIYSFMQVNGSRLLEVSKSSKKGLHLTPSQTGLERAIEFYPDGSAILLLNSNKKGDKKAGGAFKDVSIAVNLVNGKQFVSASSSGESITNETDRGLEFMKTLQSTGWVHKIGNSIEYVSKNGTIKKRLLMDRYNLGDLMDAIQSGELTRKEKEKIAYDLIAAIASFHQMGYLHRDLKPENILVNRNENGEIEIAIIDFDFACRQDDQEQLQHMRGTSEFLSPEYAKAMNNIADVTTQAHDIAAVTIQAHDVWALGCILFQLFDMKAIGSSQPGLPWYDQPEKKLYRTLTSLRDGWLKEPEDTNSFEHIAWEMLQVSPQNRITPYVALDKLLVEESNQIRQKELQAEYTREAEAALEQVKREAAAAREEWIKEQEENRRPGALKHSDSQDSGIEASEVQ